MLTKTIFTTALLFAASQAFANEDAFKQLDVDSSGTINAEEAVAMEGLQETMSEYDLNGDRELDQKEFTLFIETMAAKAAS